MTAMSSIIQVFVDILWDDQTPPVPTYKFSGPGGIVSETGHINLAAHAKRVLILFILDSAGEEKFHADPIAVDRKIAGNACPSRGTIHAKFRDPTLDPSRRMLAIMDDNSGTAKDEYKYALYFTDHMDIPIDPPCDPVIVNR